MGFFFLFYSFFFLRSESTETLKPSTEDANQINADPTLAPRRAYSMEVVGKWTQIVRQQQKVQNKLVTEADELDSTPASDTEKTRQMVAGSVMVDPRMKLLTLRKLKEKRDNTEKTRQMAAVASVSPVVMVPASAATNMNSHETRHLLHDEKIRQIARVVEEEEHQEEEKEKNM